MQVCANSCALTGESGRDGRGRRRKWWDYMAPLMDVNPDNSPVSHDLREVFHLD